MFAYVMRDERLHDEDLIRRFNVNTLSEYVEKMRNIPFAEWLRLMLHVTFEGGCDPVCNERYVPRVEAK